jgi:predicted PolB exonuclease-like 3'-5' exonuclease
VENIDTANVRKSMATKYTSLDIVCKCLWIDTPKDWIDWSQVQSYYESWRLNEIVQYCERDVRAVYEVYKVFQKLYL